MEALRVRYQKSLLVWLKTADNSSSPAALVALAGLQEALRDIAELLPEKQAIANAGKQLFAAIAEGRLPPDLEYRRLAGRIEQTLRAEQNAEKNQETLDGLLAALSSAPAPKVALPPSQAEELPPPQAEELPPPQVEALPPPQAEELPPPQAEELPPPKAEELPPPQAEELPPSQAEELPPPQVEELPPPQAEELPPPQAEELPSPQAEELPPPQAEALPPSQAEELPSPQAEELPSPQAEELPPPQAEELPPPQAEELPPLQAEELPPPQAEELPPLQAEELSPLQAEELPPPQAEELPPPQVEELPPPQAEELPPPQAEELPPPQAEELPPPQAEELPSTQSELLLSSQAELPATAVPEKKDPLTATLEATTDLLPLLGEKPREPRFSLQQRALWDAAVEAFALAWESHRSDFAAAATSGSTEDEPSADWESLRRAIFRLLEGALPLEHPAPLHLAEALASALDELDVAPPTPRLLTALTACLELLQEKDFLEHEALDDRIAQLVSSLERRNEGTRSRAVDQLFAHEALEEIEQMRIAMDALPPDTEIIAESARNLQSLAEPLELSALALAASHFARLVIMLDPACLDDSPGRDDTLAWIADMETWINQISKGESPPPPARLNELQTRLEML